MCRAKIRAASISLVLSLGLLPTSIAAHHGTNISYDRTTTVTIKGDRRGILQKPASRPVHQRTGREGDGDALDDRDRADTLHAGARAGTRNARTTR